jgi:hypothetical protein
MDAWLGHFRAVLDELKVPTDDPLVSTPENSQFHSFRDTMFSFLQSKDAMTRAKVAAFVGVTSELCPRAFEHGKPEICLYFISQCLKLCHERFVSTKKTKK